MPKNEITGADKNKLIPTDIGIVVNDFLVEYFPISWTTTLQPRWKKI